MSKLLIVFTVPIFPRANCHASLIFRVVEFTVIVSLCSINQVLNHLIVCFPERFDMVYYTFDQALIAQSDQTVFPRQLKST